MGLGSERRAVRASLSGREPATGIGLGRGVTLLLWAHGVGVHADAPAHSFPTNADARGEAVRTMPRTLACYPPDRMTAGGSRAVTKYITSALIMCGNGAAMELRVMEQACDGCSTVRGAMNMKIVTVFMFKLSGLLMSTSVASGKTPKSTWTTLHRRSSRCAASRC